MGKYKEYKQEDSSLELLSQLHDMIKQHPYRFSNDVQYWDNYVTLLRELSDISYYEIKKVYSDYKNWSGMWHDFNASIWNKNITHIERCIMEIHKFIDTGEFNEYYTYYNGCNIQKGINRLRKYVIDKETKEYAPIYTEDEININIEYHLKKRIEENSYIKYHDSMVNYFRKLKDKLYNVNKEDDSNK
jgi:hypothetical protein